MKVRRLTIATLALAIALSSTPIARAARRGDEDLSVRDRVEIVLAKIQKLFGVKIFGDYPNPPLP